MGLGCGATSFSVKSTAWQGIVLACLLVIFGGAAACKTAPLFAPTESSINLVANPTVVPLNGETILRATVVEPGGTPVPNGTQVFFTTTLGVLGAESVGTENSVAMTTLHILDQSGIATIGASSGTAVAEPLDILVGGAALAALTLVADPTALPPVGGVSSLLATAFDAAGNILPNIPVAFSTDAGVLGATTVITDENGEARTELSTDRNATVTAEAGGTESVAGVAATLTITVNVPANISISVTSLASVGEPTSLGVTVTAGDSPISSVVVDYGDGTTEPLGALTGQTTVTHTYATTGTFTARLTVIDASGETVQTQTAVVITLAAPLSVTINPPVGVVLVNTPVTLSVSVSPGTPILAYDWDFGDGTSDTTTGTTITHVYTTPGIKSVSVTARAQDGRQGSGTTEIIIEGDVPSPINVTISAPARTVSAGTTLQFSVTVTPAEVGIIAFEWDFGDGTVINTSSTTINHVYATGGTKTVTVTAFADDGRTASSTTSLAVSP